METTYLVQRHSSGRVKFTKLMLEGDTVSREWGLIDGKIQVTSNTYDYINKGKANEQSPEEAAQADYLRIIETREKEGYKRTDSLDELPDLDDNDMDFDNLPEKFCCSKPYISISKSKFDKLVNESSQRIFIKENGSCHFILSTTAGEIKIYTRRIEDHTRKYPALVRAYEDVGLPPKTLIAAELTVGESNEFQTHMDRFKRFQSISKSDTLKGKVKDDVTKTLALQEETPVIAVMFNLLYLRGQENLSGVPYSLNIGTLQDIESYDTSGFIKTPTEMDFTSYNKAYNWAHDNLDMVEGLVVWNQLENAEITFNGKPNRRACYKLKAVREDDVVAYAWEEGKGSRQGKVAKLFIGKYNLEGELVPMGKAGSGLKPKQGHCEPEYWADMPIVIEIQYDQRFESGAYQFARFIKKHEDKIPSEVLVDENGF